MSAVTCNPYAPFDVVRKNLEAQYENAVFDSTSGLSIEELKREFNRYLSENSKADRILTKARLFELICDRGRIVAEPEDYFAGKVEHGNLLVNLRFKWLEKEMPTVFENVPEPVKGSFESIMDTSHTCPNWENLMRYGLVGLRDRALEKQGVFYQSVAIVYASAARLARRIGEASNNSALSALAHRAPQTLHEALQLAYFYNELQELDGEEVRSMGRFDQIFNSFYIEDIRAGSLTHDEAKEMLKYFWIKFYAKDQGQRFGKPFLFGPEVNELSFLSFEVYREMKVVDPKFHVCISKKTDPEFIRSVMDCIMDGCTSIVFSNYEKTVKMLIENGRSPEDAGNYILIGCYEPAVMGEEMNCSGSTSLNLANGLELTLAEKNYSTFDQFFNAYLNTLDTQIEQAVERTRRFEKIWPRANPSPLLSGNMEYSFESGKDVSAGGAKYNMSGFICAGLANVVDSLAVIRQLVYEEQACTMTELRKALADDWDGHEKLRLAAVNRIAKWGNNYEHIDMLGVKIADFLAKRINGKSNARGGRFQAALYSIIVTSQKYGSLTGALSDGRRAGLPLAINTGASPGLEKNGVTSLVNSVTRIKLDQFPCGTVLDIVLHPSAIQGTNGADTLKAIVDTYFEQGGMAIQFNIFDAETLRKAQREPEKYAGLQVRVCGWNVRFTDLSPEEQDIFITKAEVA